MSKNELSDLDRKIDRLISALGLRFYLNDSWSDPRTKLSDEYGTKTRVGVRAVIKDILCLSEPRNPSPEFMKLIHKFKTQVQKDMRELPGIHYLWNKACEHDKISPDSPFIVFSDDNPFIKEYNEALNKYFASASEGGDIDGL